MRAVDCPCGEHFEAETDTKVLEALSRHAENEHPDRYQESELQLLVNTMAYNAAA
ncbi:MAG: DUF1059 domain-containing protein [Candidatus Limnocylindria bacterium]